MMRQPLRSRKAGSSTQHGFRTVQTSVNLTWQGLMARGGYYIDSKVLDLEKLWRFCQSAPSQRRLWRRDTNFGKNEDYFLYEELPNYAVREPCEAHSWAYTAHKNFTVNFKKRNSNATFSTPTPFTHWLCVPTRIPTGSETELKPARILKLVKLQSFTGRTWLSLSFQNKIFLLLFLKFTPDLDLLNQKCQSASRLTQAVSHSRRLIHICLLSVWSFPFFTLHNWPTDTASDKSPCERIHVPTLWMLAQASRLGQWWTLPLEMSGQHGWSY